MNLAYLDSLPEVANKFKVDLEDGEKVIFNAKLSTFGTEKDRMLGSEGAKFTLTNKHIIVNNGSGIWTTDIAEDIVKGSGKRVKGRTLLIFPYDYYSILLNKEVIYNDGREKLTGFHFYFKGADKEKFEKIANNVFN